MGRTASVASLPFLFALALALAPVRPAYAEGAPAPDDEEESGTAPDTDSSDGDEAVVPGPADVPPGPTIDAAPTPPDPDNGARRSIRGLPFPGDSDTDPNRKALREFEEQAFGPSSGGVGGVPRGEGKPGERMVRGGAGAPPHGIGKDDIPAELRSPAQPGVGPHTRPEEVRPDLAWLRGLKVGDLAVRWDPRVIRFLEFYKDDPRGRSIMSSWVAGMVRYRKVIQATLARHKLPADLLYVCMIESSFDPRNTSWVGASGLWQFMPSAAQVYGLNRSYWVDDRNDPEKATEAAALMLGDLKARFGTWELALAAYNAGHGAVLNAIAKYNTNDYWKLIDLESGLPWESSVYVPKALAAAVVGHNLAAFGYDKVADASVFEFDRVKVPTSVSFSVLANATGSDEKTIRDLNPELRRRRTPPGEWAVRIPRGSKDRFALLFPQLRGDWDRYDAYVVRHGERFEDVATTHGVSARALRDLNGVDQVAELRGGTTIVVPRLDEATRRKNRAEADNDLYRSDMAPGEPGDPMIVALPDKDFAVADRRRVFYRVVVGDTLEGVASALGVRPLELSRWNGLDPDARIQARMVLMAFVDPKFDADKAQVALLDEARLHLVTAGSPEHLALVEGRRGRTRITVQAKRGETLESIGRRYGLNGRDMARINRRNFTQPLAEGEELVVYKVVDRRKAARAGLKVKVPPEERKAVKGKGRTKRAEGSAAPADADADHKRPARADDGAGEGKGKGASTTKRQARQEPKSQAKPKRAPGRQARR